jgi:hypothetical protein
MAKKKKGRRTRTALPLDLSGRMQGGTRGGGDGEALGQALDLGLRNLANELNGPHFEALAEMKRLVDSRARGGERRGGKLKIIKEIYIAERKKAASQRGMSFEMPKDVWSVITKEDIEEATNYLRALYAEHHGGGTKPKSHNFLSKIQKSLEAEGIVSSTDSIRDALTFLGISRR